MKKSNGFTFIEMLVSISIILMLASLAIPIASKIKAERQKLSDTRMFIQLLHDELQHILYDKERKTNDNFTRKVRNRELSFSLYEEGVYQKGCVSWKNAVQKQESHCLYGHTSK
ncbi:type II secretion system protein [Aciduricibacillus chroicocephali]|uniref:Type II secretion system protein n=1 Tax=Aciduricibacillus chroicocephali TaxID=3054939 RepID=A0ABY9KSN3_9BACI|nr:type II secretion system protein [Bacillaceae bacterium 44XB]